MEKVRIQEGSGEECEMKNGSCRQGTFRSGGRKVFPRAEQLSEGLGVGGGDWRSMRLDTRLERCVQVPSLRALDAVLETVPIIHKAKGNCTVFWSKISGR